MSNNPKEEINSSDNEEKKEDKENKIILLIFILLLLVLIIIILLLFWLFRPPKLPKLYCDSNDLYKIIEYEYTVADAETNTSEENSEDTSTYSSNDKTTSSSTSSASDTNSTDIVEVTGDFTITSKGKEITENLEIFRSYLYNGVYMIYPGLDGTYNYTINNNLNIDVTCTVTFAEGNTEGIPMYYKLLQEGEYIKGNDTTYVTYDDLDYEIEIASGESIDFELIWKWFESDDDNKYGDITKDITYELTLTFRAEEN